MKMTAFANFLFLNEIANKDIADYLGVSQSFISNVCSGVKKLSKDKMGMVMNNPYGWDTSPLEGRVIQTIGNHSNNNTQSVGDSDLYKRLCEEKDKRIAELERTIQILLAR